MKLNLVTVGVLLAFRFSIDGITTREAVEGFDVDIPDDLVAGLTSEGFIGKPTGKRAPEPEVAAEPAPAAEAGGAPHQAAPTVEIPDDWQTLGWFKAQALAKAITGTAPANKVAYVTVMEAEIARRAAAAAA